MREKSLYEARFQGVERIYGKGSLEKLRNLHIAVIGVGGVGSWASESLARSGVGKLTLIDLDDICSSNINRQCHALTSTIGRFKTDVMKERILEINPHCEVHIFQCFYSEKNFEKILAPQYDYILDAFDKAKEKAHLINACLKKKQKLLVIGGAGGKKLADKIQVKDIAHSYQDPLLFRTRKELKKTYGYLRPSLKKMSKKKKLGVPCVFSSEMPNLPQCFELKKTINLNCQNGYGSLSFVVSTFAQRAVSHILNEILLRRPYS